MTEKILDVKNLTVQFGKEIIIENINFEVRKGDIVTIIGPNGAGKTTLIRTLLGILGHEGKIEWKEGIKINYLPQELSKEKFKQLPMSIKEFFKFKTSSTEEIIKALKDVGLDANKKMLEKNPSEFSSGQFQRMLIAWSLIDKPDVLLLDEPTSGIDVEGEKTIYSLLKKVWDREKLTIFIVTHDLNVVYGYSNKCLCISKIKTCFGSPKTILTPQALQKIYRNKIKFYKHTHR